MVGSTNAVMCDPPSSSSASVPVLTAQIAAEAQKWLASAPAAPSNEDAGAALVDVVARALTAAASRPPTGQERTQLLNVCAGVLNHMGKVPNCHKASRALAAATTYAAAESSSSAATDKELAEFTVAIVRAAGQLAQRYRVDKDFSADTLRGVTQALRRCLSPDVQVAVVQAAGLPPDKVAALLTFAVESSWVLVARGAEVFHTSGAEAAAATVGGREARDGLQELRALLLRTHADRPDTSINKGVDACTRMLMLAAKTGSKNCASGSGQELDRLLASWDAVILDGARRHTVTELQRLVLWGIEGQAAALPRALDATFDALLAAVDRAALNVPDATASALLGFLRASIRAELAALPSTGRRGGGEIEPLGVIDELAAACTRLPPTALDASALELLGKVPSQAARVVAASPSPLRGRAGDRLGGVVDAVCALAAALLPPPPSSAPSSSAATAASPSADEAKAVALLSRALSAPFIALQKVLAGAAGRPDAALTAVSDAAVAVFRALRRLVSELGTSSSSSSGGGGGASRVLMPAVAAAQRAIGTCLSQCPVADAPSSSASSSSSSSSSSASSCGAFEAPAAGPLCDALGDHVAAVFAAWPAEHDLTGVAVTLASMVGSRCLSNRQFRPVARLLSTALVAVDTGRRGGAVVDEAPADRMLHSLVTAAARWCIGIGADADNAALSADELLACCLRVAPCGVGDYFLFSLSATVLRYVSAGAAAAASPAGATAPWAVALEQILLAAGEGRSKVSGDEVDVMLAAVRSAQLWVVAHRTAGGAADARSAAVIDSLKTMGDRLDPLSMERVEISRGKSRRRAVPKPSAGADATPADRWRALAVALRVWVLLAQWALPLTARPEDRAASDGTAGASEYLTAAVKACLGLFSAGTGPSAPPAGTFARVAVPTDVRALFHLLGMHGRSGDQVRIVRGLQAAVPVFCPSSSSPAALAAPSLQREYLHAVEELSLLLDIQSVWAGAAAGPAPVAGATPPRRPEGRGLRTAWGDDAPTGDKENTSANAPTPPAAGAGAEGKRRAAGYSLKEVVDLSAALLSRATDATAMTPQSYLAAVDTALTSGGGGSGSGSGSGGETSAAQHGLSVRAWAALLSAKVLFFVWGDHYEAHVKVRLALGWTAAAAVDAAAAGAGAAAPSAVAAVTAAADRCWPRLEALALKAELHEHAGGFEKCLTYMGDARALGQAVSRALSNLLSLHYVRVWHRLGSDRLSSAVSDLLGGGYDGDAGRGCCGERALDDVSRMVQRAARALQRLLPRDADADDDDDDVGAGDARDDREALAFRHLDRVWQLPSDSSFTPAPAGAAAVRHAAVSDRERTVYDRLFALCRLPAHQTLPTDDACVAAVEAIDEALAAARPSLAFDVVRDVRRAAALAALSLPPAAVPPFRAFLLGASSVGTALECGLDAPACRGTAPPTTDIDSLAAASDVVRRAAAGDPAALAAAEAACGSFLAAGRGNALCFAAVEPCTGHLVVGRVDGRGPPTVVSVPHADEVRSLLQAWRACLDRSKAMLQRTRSEKASQALTEEEKRQWWAERQETDASIEALLARLQRALGPAAQLLTGAATSSSSSSASLAAALGALTMDASQGATAAAVSAATEGSGGDASMTAEEVDALKVTDIRRLLKDRGLSTAGRKNELAERLLEAFAAQRQGKCDGKGEGDGQSRTGSDDRAARERYGRKGVGGPVGGVAEAGSAEPYDGEGCTVLILDEQLQQIPVECMPLLRGRHCSRVPSLALFLLMVARRAAPAPAAAAAAPSLPPAQRKGQTQQAPSTAPAAGAVAPSLAPSPSPSRGWYAIDPEKNLSGTRSTMLAFLEPYIARWAWQGYVAEMPPEDTVKELHALCDVFVYCGHGAGEKMCETHKMRRWPALPAAYLWGCSSGRLAAVGVHDPTGAALNYLLGGATFVVGNMWDVTDKDIDKLSKECMRLGFDGRGDGQGALPVTQALVLSRDVCKMRFAVGCAPVVYGF